MWSKIKELFGGFVSLIISAILLAAIVVAGILIANNSENDANNENTARKPEVAQIFEPSISTPLPADVNTEEQSTSKTAETTPTEDTGRVAGDSTTTTNFVAPASGIDQNQPIPYNNTSHGIQITVPAHTSISEQDNLITFGTIFYISIINSTESLDQISKELANSSDVQNIQTTTLSGKQALRFTIKGQTGYVVLKNNKAYYLIGQDNYLTQIKL